MTADDCWEVRASGAVPGRLLTSVVSDSHVVGAAPQPDLLDMDSTKIVTPLKPHRTTRRTEMSHQVHAELVANVLTIVAAAGQRVGPQDTVVILESMKMEIPVHAEVAGTVSEIAVSVGDVVTEGDLIAEIDED
jgi:acetyl-CoA carboxylase biotin carboxyl carrier protein